MQNTEYKMQNAEFKIILSNLQISSAQKSSMMRLFLC